MNDTLKKIISEICSEEKIKTDQYCDSYCFKLTKDNKFTYIYDNVFENNPASLYKILKDKSAVYELLNSHKIPCVEHFYFFSKGKIDNDLENKLNFQLNKYKKLVIKHNEGMSGNDVYFIDNSNDLISKSKRIFNKYHSLTISPFYNFLHEYRVVVLNGKVKLAFDKIRPFIVGDGKTTVQKLAHNKYGNKMMFSKNVNPQLIAKANEKITLNWKHNLNFGSVPEIVNDDKILERLSKIATSASNALNIKFACIDIIETDDNEYKVLEINGSVTMGKFASFSETNYNLAKEIYREAILDNFK